MLIEINSFSSKDKDLFNKAMNIRFQVFTEEQGVDKDLEFDGLDFEATHYIVIVDEKPVATARWRELSSGIKIERMAVLKEFRKFGFGNLLLRFVLNELKTAKVKVYLHSQSYITSFYKHAGFDEEGEEFEEAGIKHFKMVLKK